MKNILLLTVLLIFVTTSKPSAQERVTVGETQKIVSPNEGEFFSSPAWSPDGNFIAFTGSNYTGIFLKDLNSGEVLKITDEKSAGFGFEWSNNSEFILSRVSKYEGVKRYNAVKIFNIENKASIALTDYKTSLQSIPHWINNNSKIYSFDDNKLEIIATGIESNDLKKSSVVQKIIYPQQDKIAIGENQQDVKIFTPFPNAQYLNLVLSPDGLKIAFEVYGGNMYVMDIADGGVPVDLGKGFRPKWSPDNKRLVYMVTEDDGQSFTASDIYVININGSGKDKLTDTDDRLEMDPSWSPDGKKIAFSEYVEGAIYVLPVTIELQN